jgi:hypothetical protein
MREHFSPLDEDGLAKTLFMAAKIHQERPIGHCPK